MSLNVRPSFVLSFSRSGAVCCNNEYSTASLHSALYGVNCSSINSSVCVNLSYESSLWSCEAIESVNSCFFSSKFTTTSIRLSSEAITSPCAALYTFHLFSMPLSDFSAFLSCFCLAEDTLASRVSISSIKSDILPLTSSASKGSAFTSAGAFCAFIAAQ